MTRPKITRETDQDPGAARSKPGRRSFLVRMCTSVVAVVAAVVVRGRPSWLARRGGKGPRELDLGEADLDGGHGLAG